MLVLTRRVDESLTIGDSIVITVLGIEGDKVKLGIKAPREITILRQEIYDAVQEQNKLEQFLASRPEPESFKGLRDLLTEESSDSASEKPESENKAEIKKDDSDEEKPAQQ